MKNAVRIFSMTLIIMIISVAYVYAQEYKLLTTDEMKKTIDQKKKVVIVDARTLPEFEQGHLPGAINIPDDKYEVAEKYLPKKKNTAIIIYCRGYS